MGYSTTTRDDLSARSANRAATGSAFAHTTTMDSTPTHLRTIHPSVDPKWTNAAGEQIRECLDSDAHPITLPVFVGFDETGSMGEAPMILRERLATLKGALLRAGLDDAQLCFGAYGDAQNGEVAPCQVGQFESGIEMEDWLNNLYLERLGGGNSGETAGLLLYFLARHSRLDSVTKRGQKGYLILTGDESPLPFITRAEVKRYIGDDIQADLTIGEVVAEVQKLYDVYFFHLETGAAVMQNSLSVWTGLLGADHVVPIQGLDTIAEQMAMLIARKEGIVDTIAGAAELLLAEGADPDTVRRAGQAMMPFEQHLGAVAPATSTGRLPQAPESDSPTTRRL
jgi:hypothetical protein